MRVGTEGRREKADGIHCKRERDLRGHSSGALTSLSQRCFPDGNEDVTQSIMWSDFVCNAAHIARQEVPSPEPIRTVMNGGSAKAPLRLHRGSAQGLGSLESGSKAGEEDSVEDEEGVHVLGVVK